MSCIVIDEASCTGHETAKTRRRSGTGRQDGLRDPVRLGPSVHPRVRGGRVSRYLGGGRRGLCGRKKGRGRGPGPLPTFRRPTTAGGRSGAGTVQQIHLFLRVHGLLTSTWGFLGRTVGDGADGMMSLSGFSLVLCPLFNPLAYTPSRLVIPCRTSLPLPRQRTDTVTNVLRGGNGFEDLGM